MSSSLEHTHEAAQSHESDWADDQLRSLVTSSDAPVTSSLLLVAYLLVTGALAYLLLLVMHLLLVQPEKHCCLRLPAMATRRPGPRFVTERHWQATGWQRATQAVEVEQGLGRQFRSFDG